jgi:HEPN domain-containing protein
VINLRKQIDYWINGSADDLETAKVLIERKRFIHGLFFCHLVIEKVAKANVVKNTNEIAPRSHNLFYLLEKAGITLSENQEIFIGILMKYQLQGRYPDYNPKSPSSEIVDSYLEQTENLMLWLQKQL